MLALILSPLCGYGDDEAYQPHDSIQKAATEFIMQHTDAYPVMPKVSDVMLDRRLNLAACDQPLQAGEPPNGLRGGRSVVEVRCEGSKPWKIFVPVRVELPGMVVVSSEMLPKDTLIRADHVRLQQQDLAKLPSGYMTELNDAVGRRTKRAIRAGSIVSPSALQQAKMVKRGNAVTILADADSFQVRMRGEALANGVAGERIKVKNSSSGRVVSATVIGRDLVKVTF